MMLHMLLGSSQTRQAHSRHHSKEALRVAAPNNV